MGISLGTVPETLLLAVARVLGSIASASVALLFVMPFEGALTRMRVFYMPKDAPSAAGQGGQQNFFYKLALSIAGVFQMMARTKRLEGWSALWSGTTLRVVELAVLTMLSLEFKLTYLDYWRAPDAPEPNGLLEKLREVFYIPNALRLSVLPLVLLPIQVLVVRYVCRVPPSLTHSTIVHPQRANWMQPRRALSLVLTGAERQQPWRLYTLPGVLLTALVREFWAIVTLFINEEVTLQMIGGAAPESNKPIGLFRTLYKATDSHLPSFALVFLWEVLGIVVQELFATVFARLAAQAVPQTPGGDAAAPTAARPQRKDAGPVVLLRPHRTPEHHKKQGGASSLDEPYTGAVDCVRKVAREEGTASLMRGAWVTIFNRINSRVVLPMLP